VANENWFNALAERESPMLKTGAEHLESIRDGRIVYLGKERIDDVTTHPAFKNAAQTIASLYDFKAAPENREKMSYEADGGRHSLWFLQPRSRDDLERRRRAHKQIADLTYGMLGRSMDHVSSFVTGMAMMPEVFEAGGAGYGDNMVNYYRHMRDNDLYAAYAVIPPQAARNPEFYEQQSLPIPTLRVVREDDDGVVLDGMKMLATGGIFSNDLWIGNLIPLAPSQKKEAITCAVPVGTPGVTLWSRQSLERNAHNEFDSPLSYRFDETDAMVMCRNVKVPWEKVFVKDDPVLARNIYIDTPGHCFGNHQANVRFLSKLQLIVGLASRVTQSSGADQIPAVRETLGRLAAFEATLGGLIAGQVQDLEHWPGGDEGYVCFNRRYMYAALNWCTENHSSIIDILRELCGGGVFQMPASVDVMLDDNLRDEFQQYWSTPQLEAVDRVKLFKLAWDMVGSEFAGRHQQYEKFYAGASFIVRNHNYRETPWDDLHGIVDDLMASYDVPTADELATRKQDLDSIG
jgi:4-hydroxyphenylacetate 3-monooxygenase